MLRERKGGWGWGSEEGKTQKNRRETKNFGFTKKREPFLQWWILMGFENFLERASDGGM